MVLAVGSYQLFVEGTKFHVWCDHETLKWILTTIVCTINHLDRWGILLAEIDDDVKCMPGPQHAVA